MENIKNNYKAFQQGVSLFQEFSEYIESKIKLECSIDFYFHSDQFIIQIRAKSKNHSIMRYSISFCISAYFTGLSTPPPEVFTTSLDRYISEANSSFKEKYLK